MRFDLNADRWLGLCVILLSVVLIFVWIPLDTDSGIIEKVRRRLTIGDALGPTVAGGILLFGGLLTFLQPSSDAPALTKHNLIWMVALLVCFALSLGIMRWAGPALGALLAEDGYRPLRDTLPWKYLGYVLGGTLMITGLGAMMHGHVSCRFVVLGLIASLIIAMAYDLPFDDLILPPNGDV